MPNGGLRRLLTRPPAWLGPGLLLTGSLVVPTRLVWLWALMLVAGVAVLQQRRRVRRNAPLVTTSGRWVGGALLPSRTLPGGVSASFPCAVLGLRDRRIRLRMRPRAVAWLFDVDPVELPADSSVTVFPAAGRRGGSFVGLQHGTGAPVYFAASRLDRPQIVASLQAAGCIVSSVERAVRHLA